MNSGFVWSGTNSGSAGSSLSRPHTNEPELVILNIQLLVAQFSNWDCFFSVLFPLLYSFCFILMTFLEPLEVRGFRLLILGTWVISIHENVPPYDLYNHIRIPNFILWISEFSFHINFFNNHFSNLQWFLNPNKTHKKFTTCYTYIPWVIKR
jgi:hypothetical protein